MSTRQKPFFSYIGLIFLFNTLVQTEPCDNKIGIFFNNKENENPEWNFTDSFGVQDTTYLFDSSSVEVTTSDEKVTTASIKYRSIVHDSIMVEFESYLMLEDDTSYYAVYPKFGIRFDTSSYADTLSYAEVLYTELQRLGKLIGDKKPFTPGMLDTIFNPSIGNYHLSGRGVYCLVNPGLVAGYDMVVFSGDTTTCTTYEVVDTTLCVMFRSSCPSSPFDLPAHIEVIEEYTGIKHNFPANKKTLSNSSSPSAKLVSIGANSINNLGNYFKVYDLKGRLVSEKIFGLELSRLIHRTKNCYIVYPLERMDK